MVSLPDAENRGKILKVILQKEALDPSLQVSEVASLTEGFSGSDLKVILSLFFFLFEIWIKTHF